jgi:Ca2+-binding EF-hand superfamily protein
MTKTRAVLFAALVMLIPAAAFAEHPHPDQQPQKVAKQGRQAKKAKMKARMKAKLVARFDADGDGRLTGDERVQARAAVQQLRAQRRAKKIERMVRALRRFDVNGDGWVDEAEIRSATDRSPPRRE